MLREQGAARRWSVWWILCISREKVGETGRTLGKEFLMLPPIFISTFLCSKKPSELVLPLAGHRVFWEGSGQSGESGMGQWASPDCM